MCEPTAQDYHSDQRIDDSGILGPHLLVRHLVTPMHVVPCPINGVRISSQAFVTRKEHAGVSIDLECLLAAAGLAPDARFGTLRDTLAVGVVTAADARAVAKGAAWTPKPAEPELKGTAAEANPYHGEIILGDLGSSARKKASRGLSESCKVIRIAAQS